MYSIVYLWVSICLHAARYTYSSRMDAMSYVARQRDGRVAGSYESRAPFITASIAAILGTYYIQGY